MPPSRLTMKQTSDSCSAVFWTMANRLLGIFKIAPNYCLWGKPFLPSCFMLKVAQYLKEGKASGYFWPK